MSKNNKRTPRGVGDVVAGTSVSNPSPSHTHGAIEGYSAGQTHAHPGGDIPHDHDHGSYVGPGANWRMP